MQFPKADLVSLSFHARPEIVDRPSKFNLVSELLRGNESEFVLGAMSVEDMLC